jgi:hypothetical protein
MPKTLVIILNHNLPELTNWLYYSLKKFQDETHDILVMDNGSKPDLIPSYTQIRLKKNYFWGGALNEAFKLVLENREYDSMMFLNNDIELTPEIFVRSMREAMFANDFAIVSPCIAGKPLPWRQMQNWGSRIPRIVQWIDNPAPLFHRKIIEAIRQFPEELYIGWGQEMICYDTCVEHGWKTAVCDHIAILHQGKQTLLQNKLYGDLASPDKNHRSGEQSVSWEDFKAEAIKTRDAYFEKNPLKNVVFKEFNDYGIHYTYRPGENPVTKQKSPTLFGKLKKAIRKSGA